jgi:hypothetical protein
VYEIHLEGLLVINLKRHMQNLYTENCKALLREIKDEPNKWHDILNS